MQINKKSIARSTALLIGGVCFLAGVIYGFLLSPVKRGIHVNVENRGYGGGRPQDR